MTSARIVDELSRVFLADGDGFVAVVRLYMDESGTHGTSPVVTVGGYLGTRPEWVKWTKRWNAAKRPIKIFHAVDCQNGAGEFANWSKDKRTDLVKKLLPIIADANLLGVAVGILIEPLEAIFRRRPEFHEMFGTPYGACFQWTLHSILDRAAQGAQRPRIAIVHERNDYHSEAMSAFDYVKEHRDQLGLLQSLTFGSKEDYPPLQAADILAYEANKRLRDRKKPERRALLAIKKKLNIAVYHEGNMRHFESELDGFRDQFSAIQSAVDAAKTLRKRLR